MRVLVVGLGEVGSALYDVISESGKFEVFGYDIDPARAKHRLEEISRPIDYLHVAIPFKESEGFINIVWKYIKAFSPRAVFIHSTVALGTSRKVYERCGIPVAYTPIRGKHPNLRRHILFWPKWVAVIPNDNELMSEIRSHLESIGFKVRVSGSPESLELAKLWETVYRAVMIVAWQEVHRVARKFGADIAEVAEFVAEVHEVLRDRPVYYPDYIGGHCLIPNTKILNGVHPSKLWDFILESNELRAKEREDKEIAEDIRRVKRVWLKLANKEYYSNDS